MCGDEDRLELSRVRWKLRVVMAWDFWADVYHFRFVTVEL